MREAISAYSIAVAPDSLAAKFLIDLNIVCSCCENPIQRQTQ
jgi:hypothetical protein